MLQFWKSRKRRELRGKPFPAEWQAVLRRRMPIYAALSLEDRSELHGLVHVFLEEKRFEACGGLELSDEIRVTIAAQACLLLLHRDTDFFPAMRSILVYPDEFVVDVAEQEDDWIVSEYSEDRTGESWDYGPVVLSWRDVLAGASEESDGYNVVLHEFAHQLDLESGAVDGAPKLENAAQYDEWHRVFSAAYESHREAVERGRRTALDEYGAEGPAEFFAVIVEAFFETPQTLRTAFEGVYELLEGHFRQDPLGWSWG